MEEVLIPVQIDITGSKLDNLREFFGNLEKSAKLADICTKYSDFIKLPEEIIKKGPRPPIFLTNVFTALFCFYAKMRVNENKRALECVENSSAFMVIKDEKIMNDFFRCYFPSILKAFSRSNRFGICYLTEELIKNDYFLFVFC